MKTAETKIYSLGYENVQLYHNTGVAGLTFVGPLHFNPWNLIAQGTGKQQRVGDTISPRGMSIRLWMANKLDRPNVMYRVMVLVLPKTYNNARVTAGSIDIAAPIWTGGGNGNYMCLPIDTEKGIKVLYDRVFSNEKGSSNILPGTNKECHIFKKLWIKRRKGSSAIRFESNGAQDILNKPLAVYCIPYDSYGTLVTDNIASCAYVTRMYYKDI